MKKNIIIASLLCDNLHPINVMYITIDDIRNSSKESNFFGFFAPLSFPSNFYKIYKNLSLDRLRLGIVKKMQSDLSSIYILAKGINTLSQEGKVEYTIENHELIRNFLSRYRRMYYKIESINFFDNQSIKELSSDTLSEIYAVERKFRHKAYENVESKGHDKVLIDYASNVSLTTASNYNAAT